MLRKKLAAIFVVVAVGATGIYIAPGTASAMPISGSLPDIVKSDPISFSFTKGKKGHKHVKKKWSIAAQARRPLSGETGGIRLITAVGGIRRPWRETIPAYSFALAADSDAGAAG